MTRYPVANGDYFVQNLVPQSQEEFGEFQRTVPVEIPPGFRSFIRWTDFEVSPGDVRSALSYGIEREDGEPIVPPPANAESGEKKPLTFEQLNAMKKEQLVARGAELELDLNMEMTKTAMVQKILQRLHDGPAA
jgi:hypothetical protein